jgi:signal transduction histidine kinase/CheY-like chemotaxis protein
MSWLLPSVIATAAGTALLSFVYCYLYFIDRKKYLAIWALSWFVYFTRYIFLLGMITDQRNEMLLIGNQLACLLSGVILLWGTYRFIEKPFPKTWLYCSGVGVVWIIVSISFHFSFLLMAIPTFTFLAMVYIWTGLTFVKSGAPGSERKITGFAFIVWGLHKGNYPFLRPVVWLAPWGYLLAAMLEFIVALGMLLVYFRKVRDDLKEGKYYLQKAQEIGKIGTWELDVKKNELSWTEENYKIFGIPLGTHLTYETFLACVHPDDRDYVNKEWKASFDNKSYDITHRLLVDGKVKWVREKAELEFDENRECIRGVGFTQDITELKELEGRLQQSQKMESIGILAGGIAHDFNNILFPIVGMAELLVEDLPADSLEYENAQLILKAGIRGSEIVKQILVSSRKADHKMIAFRIRPILEEVLKLSRFTIPANIEITHDIQDDCGLIMGDPAQIQQVAMNLLTNAYHAVERSGGTIWFHLRETVLGIEDFPAASLDPGHYAVLSISDNGCGIDPAHMDKIFDPYFTSKEQGKGTGLGLAVAYGIVKTHAGDIRVKSEPGKGSTFEVYLPLMEKSSQPESVKRLETHPHGTERILLVDDEEAAVQVERLMLEKLGYSVTACFSSGEAFNRFKADPHGFDLVITDMAMPKATGDELAKELNAIRPDIPIIICTGFSERINNLNAKLPGVNGILKKPISKSQMAHMVRKVLDEAKDSSQN